MTTHQAPQHAPPGDHITMGSSFNILYLLAHIHALSFTVFLRTSFGLEGIGICGLGTMVMILGWGAYANCLPMFGFFVLWLAALIVQRVRTFLDWRSGKVIVHSRYNGYPWLSRLLFRSQDELKAKGFDAFLCLAVGGILCQFNQPFGFYVMAGFSSILFTECMMVESMKRRLRQMRDAEIEQRYLAETYKSGRF